MIRGLQLDDLNPEQKKAVLETEGPLLILAGAGSGKTRVLTYRIAYILKQRLANPNEILAVTFTNKAANEMKERIVKLTKGKTMDPYQISYYYPFIGTFHSICVKILRKDGHFIGIDPTFTIYDQDDQMSCVREAMRDLHLATKEFNPKTILNYISGAKSELVDPEMYKSFARGNIQLACASVYPVYQKLLKQNSALDFDDLIIKTIELFNNANDVLKKYQEIFKYVLVDEYQDTNNAQYIFINQIAKKRRNICVVGDDDQAIYSWRGATIKNILSFEEDYPETKVVKLEQNYRSTKKILDAAFEVIKHNKNRKPKRLWTERDAGANVNIYTALDEIDEAKFVAETILDLTKSGNSLNDIAILYRTHAQSRNLEEVLLSYAIPYQIYGGISFYERKEIKDILAYLRIIYNPSDNVSLKRIINTPSRKIGTITIRKLEKKAKNQEISISKLIEQTLKEESILKNHKGLEDFAKILIEIKKKVDKLKLTDFIEYVLNASGYMKWLDDGTVENEVRIENLKELLSVASKYNELEPKEALKEFLNEVSLIEEQQVKAQSKKNKNRIILMTLHSAKGLEFPYVFIIGMEEGLFPHSRSYTDPEGMEEERRLAYVGITRAKDNLYLTHAESRRYFGSRQNNLVSRFIEDIPQELIFYIKRDEDLDESSSDEFNSKSTKKINNIKINLNKGDRVEHKEFGRGVILNIEGSIVKVDFGPIEGVKELAMEYAKLVKIS